MKDMGERFGSSVWAVPVIVSGDKKNYADVPARLKEQVKEILIDLDCSDLVTE